MMAARSAWYFGPCADWAAARRAWMDSIISGFRLPPSGSSLHGDAGELHNLCISFGFCANEIAEFGRCVADWYGCLGRQNFLHLRILQGRDCGLRQAVEDGLRRTSARQQAEPVGEVDILQSRRFSHGRDVREFW